MISRSAFAILGCVFGTALGSDVHWGYGDFCEDDVRQVEPEYWNQLSAANAACISTPFGDQTPINVDCGESTDAYYEQSFPSAMNMTITNNGHAIQLNPMLSTDGSAGSAVTDVVHWENMDPSNPTSSSNQTFNFEQLHIHWQKEGTTAGSEHAFNDVFYAMEMHFVMYNSAYANFGAAFAAAQEDSLMVFGVQFSLDDTQDGNAELQNVYNAIKGDSSTTGFSNGESTTATVNPCNFIPGGCDNITRFNFYKGGLTTPPCNSLTGSIVQWVLPSLVGTINSTQLDFFKNMVYMNNASDMDTRVLISKYGNSRPLQPRGNRTIWSAGDALGNGTCSKQTVTGSTTQPSTKVFDSCEVTTTAMATSNTAPTSSPTSAAHVTAASSVLIVTCMLMLLLV